MWNAVSSISGVRLTEDPASCSVVAAGQGKWCVCGPKATLLRVYPYLGDLKFTARRTPRSWRLTRTKMQRMGTLDISIEKKCMVIDFFWQWAASAW